jgi:hypothetical protein
VYGPSNLAAVAAPFCAADARASLHANNSLETALAVIALVALAVLALG